MSEEEGKDDRLLEALALGVEPVPPPAGLRERILAAASSPSAVQLPATRPAATRWPRVPLTALAAAIVVA
jgi:hypothetical protein